jgi:ParB-like chromosome segregation protein Spo0J
MRTFDPRIEWRDPASLTPYSNNAKTHPVEQVDKIAASIASFGFDQPIVVDGDGVIIKGHGRREASLRLGLDNVPVLVRTDLSVAEIKAARLADTTGPPKARGTRSCCGWSWRRCWRRTSTSA